VTGASTFQIGPGMDDGPVYGLLTETIRAGDTSGDLLGRLADAGAGLLMATLDGIASGSLMPVPQSPDGVSLAPKLTVADGQIRFEQSALAIDRRIRACTPAPGAWVEFRGDRLKLGPVTIVVEPDLLPGRLDVSAVRQGRVLVGTATRPIQLGTVQPPGKRPMAAADWARGARLSDGATFGPLGDRVAEASD
jgi:methionyl-tRNA formyltransferase